jgi:hypothetical protein
MDTKTLMKTTIHKEKEKYVAFWEINPDEIMKIKEKATKLAKLIKAFPWEYPKSLVGPYSWEGENKGFQIFEVSDPQQLDNLSDYWNPLIKMTFQPIVDTHIWEIGGFVKGNGEKDSLIII